MQDTNVLFYTIHINFGIWFIAFFGLSELRILMRTAFFVSGACVPGGDLFMSKLADCCGYVAGKLLNPSFKL